MTSVVNKIKKVSTGNIKAQTSVDRFLFFYSSPMEGRAVRNGKKYIIHFLRRQLSVDISNENFYQSYK